MMNIKRAVTRAALSTVGNADLVSSIAKRGVTGVSFATDHGPLIVPTNSRSIVQNFMSGIYYGEHIISTFLSIFPRAGRLLNIGANVGTSARAIAASNIYNRIDCFEPDPDNFIFLRMNSSIFPKIVLHNVALGSTVGELPLNLNPQSVGRHSFKTNFGKGNLRVPVQPIFDHVGPEEPYDIFMDIEGWEIEALHGAGSSLRNCILCALEWNSHLHSLSERKAMVKIVSSAGFNAITDLNNPHELLNISDLLHYEKQVDLMFWRK